MSVSSYSQAKLDKKYHFRISLQAINSASKLLDGVCEKTSLRHISRLSDEFRANIFFKREDLQPVRSFKIRGAYNLMASLSEEEKSRGIVAASAGNHAQGVALSCSKLGIYGVIFMPTTAPKQKIDKVKKFGGLFIRIELIGKTVDDALKAAQEYCNNENAVFVHPFDDERIIAGQGTMAAEIWDQLVSGQLDRIHSFETQNADKPVDIVIVPIGGGGMIAGIASYFKQKNPTIRIIGVEPAGANAMAVSLQAGSVQRLNTVDTFCDGVALKSPGNITFEIVRELVDEVIVIEEGQVAKDMIELYQNEGVIAESSSALTVSALSHLGEEIRGKNVVCIMSGGNNDIARYPEVVERSLIWQGLKHYFIVEFAQKPGQLKTFLESVLGEHVDIVRFEYMKKNNKETGPAFVGVELQSAEEYQPLLHRMRESGLSYRSIEAGSDLHQFLV